MEYDRAVRLRELWNNNFRLNLQIQNYSKFSYCLCGSKCETCEESMAILERLANRLDLAMKVNYLNYTIR